MVASRTAREKKAAAEAGPLARVKIDLGADQQFVYKISCTTCVLKGDRSWSAYRPGDDNGFMAAMDRWIFHLHEKHPDAEAPCLAFLPAAQQRLHERREQRAADPTAVPDENAT
ncbi:hypothetical protein [Nocardioides panaciterrulae]|uniref:Uncharacterized protein n=1 Tax=Nocardioides panaciterrulae TaxID=661492 RepID=A0A7Y9JCR3_9ACTN|nr:hypothetical protein [Nocardioides panaciterrulae]NYD43703.1 hypothetical protein [Nocardioides panaciterrulae]